MNGRIPYSSIFVKENEEDIEKDTDIDTDEVYTSIRGYLTSMREYTEKVSGPVGMYIYGYIWVYMGICVYMCIYGECIVLGGCSNCNCY